MDYVKKITTDVVEKILSKGVRDMPQNPAAQGYDERQIRSYYYIPEKLILDLISNIESDLIESLNSIKNNVDILEENLEKHQPKTDESLKTDSKKIVGAINELNESKITSLVKGEGAYSLVQKTGPGGTHGSSDTENKCASVATGKNAIALGVQGLSAGDSTLTSGFGAKAYEKACVSFGNSVAGRTGQEWIDYYWNTKLNQSANITSKHTTRSGELQDLTEAEKITVDEKIATARAQNPPVILRYADFGIINVDNVLKWVVDGPTKCKYGQWLLNPAYAEGQATKAKGTWSHAQGYSTEALADFSDASGQQTVSYAHHGHVSGYSSKNSSPYGFVHGLGLESSDEIEGQTVFGKYNIKNADAMFQVANGTGPGARKTLFEVLKDGRAKVNGAPVDNNDVVRLKELNKKVDKWSADYSKLNTQYQVPNELITLLAQKADGTYIPIYAGKYGDISKQTIVVRNPLGQIVTASPTSDSACANKKYVDDKVDDVITSFNSAIANIDKLTRKVVDTLPSVGETNIIYLVPNTKQVNDNIKDEYLWLDDKWELIGSTAIDLTEYQLKTDNGLKTKSNEIVGAINELNDKVCQCDGSDLDVQINGQSIVNDGVANIPISVSGQLGVSKTFSGNGILTGTSGKAKGYLFIVKATDDNIDEKEGIKPIVPANLDYAVKVGITTNTNELTDDEKASVQDWIGVANKADEWDGAAGGYYTLRARYQTSDGSSETGTIRAYSQPLNSAVAIYGDDDEKFDNINSSWRGYLLSLEPKRNYHVANKKYVDDNSGTQLYMHTMYTFDFDDGGYIEISCITTQSTKFLDTTELLNGVIENNVFSLRICTIDSDGLRSSIGSNFTIGINSEDRSCPTVIYSRCELVSDDYTLTQTVSDGFRDYADDIGINLDKYDIVAL